MLDGSIWISGSTKSGKTALLVEQFCLWAARMRAGSDRLNRATPPLTPAGAEEQKAEKPPSKAPRLRATGRILVFAANGDNRLELAERLDRALPGAAAPVHSTTPLGFFQEEVMLFWPLLIRRLDLRAQFPLRLRPETEQELATQLWRPELDEGTLRQEGVSEYRMVRRTLDLLQLAGTSGTPAEEVKRLLEQGMSGEEGSFQLWECMQQVLLRWRGWCLERGLLTYGIIAELYWRHLLPDATYRRHLAARYQAVLADDVDEYPAIARDLFEVLLDAGAVGAFTYNPEGGIRLGLNADPNYMAGLASRCVEVPVERSAPFTLADTLGESVLEIITAPRFFSQLPASVQSIQTTSRGELLREIAQTIVEAVRGGRVQPEDIVAIAPGLDAIARYTLGELLKQAGIPVESLKDQRPLFSSPLIRALLSLLCFLYPGLGRLLDRDAVAEMLALLSQKVHRLGAPDGRNGSSSFSLVPAIDPVRAGLLADHCYAPDIARPRLLPVTVFPRWDRLGQQASRAYAEIVQWIDIQRAQLEQRLVPSFVSALDRAIQRFLWNGSNLPYEQLSALRELMETAQHYSEVYARMQAIERRRNPTDAEGSSFQAVEQFIKLLRRGTVTANPYPVRPIGPEARAVTLANIFQYRSSRRSHRWHFWLDVGSPLWLSGGSATLFGAPLFLKEWSGRPWTPEDAHLADEQRLRRILLDLLSRASDRLYLCHSDLAVNGQEQTGPLLSLVNVAQPLS